MAKFLLTGGYPVDIIWQPGNDDPLLFPLAQQVVTRSGTPSCGSPPLDDSGRHQRNKSAFRHARGKRRIARILQALRVTELLDWAMPISSGSE